MSKLNSDNDAVYYQRQIGMLWRSIGLSISSMNTTELSK